MKSNYVTLILTLLLASFNTKAQDFNDVPGADDEQFYKLAFSAVPALHIKETKPYKLVEKNDSLELSLTDFAKQFVGIPYRSGGTTSNGFDCSGYTRHVYSNFGVTLPHSSGAQANVGKEIDLDEVQPGDLLFFKGRNRNHTRVGHVGLVYAVENGEVYMIHSSTSRGIIIEKPFAMAYYKQRYLLAKRVVEKVRITTEDGSDL